MFFIRLLYSAIGIALGFLIIVKVKSLVDLTGYNSWGEKVFGPAGTYTLYRLIGVALIFISILYLAGFSTLLGEFGASLGKMFGGGQ